MLILFKRNGKHCSICICWMNVVLWSLVETLVTCYQSTQRNIPEETNLHIHPLEKPQFPTAFLLAQFSSIFFVPNPFCSYTCIIMDMSLGTLLEGQYLLPFIQPWFPPLPLVPSPLQQYSHVIVHIWLPCHMFLDPSLQVLLLKLLITNLWTLIFGHRCLLRHTLLFVQ